MAATPKPLRKMEKKLNEGARSRIKSLKTESKFSAKKLKSHAEKIHKEHVKAHHAKDSPLKKLKGYAEAK